MTIDDAIKRLLNEAEKWESLVNGAYKLQDRDCTERAADHRQLAEWLTELKERREQPVKRGKWIDCTFYDPYEKSYEQNYEFKCSNCGHKIYNKPNDDDNLFCGHCSAKMDLPEPIKG